MIVALARLMGAEENKALPRRFIEGSQNGGNLALYDELFAPDFVNLSRAAKRGGLPPG